MPEPPRPDPEPFDPFEIVERERIYDSAWCGLRRDRLRLGAGALQEYHVFEVPDAAVAVPLLPDGRIVLLWQHRHPHGRTHWEIPAGRIAAGEDPADAARREVLEETGYRAGRLERLPGFYPLNGISDHFAHPFVARDCERVAAPAPEPAERFSVHVLERERVLAMLRAGAFADGFTALTLLYWLERERLR